VTSRRLRSVPAVQFSRHQIRLADGHRVQALVAGRGVPLVLVHGFASEGLLYAPLFSRLVSMGFKVVAIDTAGHGGTDVLPRDGMELAAYSRLLGRAVDELGIGRAVFAGHSMGGRLVAELAADDPERAIAVLLIDAIVGDAWDHMVQAWRLWPPLLGVFATTAMLDSLTTGSPVWTDVSRPWQLFAPFMSMLRSPGSREVLARLQEQGVPVVVIHGDRDFVVPLASARDAARRSGGELVVVEGGTHSWLLKDPEAFPSIVGQLLQGRLGVACGQALEDAGLDPGSATAG
jgi:pimeloyl-ACP methyl ester carboxylesterase